MFCTYFQAQVPPKNCWFVIAILKSFEHMSFARTLDAQKGIVEFFVPPSMEEQFLEVTQYFVQHHMMIDLIKLPNRLLE
jgi:Domain of unknown function (DUF4911)